MKILEDVRQASSNTNVFCTNCGAVNKLGMRECSNCDFPLEQPTTMLGNFLGALVWPQRGLRKIVATAPLIQALLIVIAFAALVVFIQVLGVLLQIQGNQDQLHNDLISELFALRFLRNPLQNLGLNPPVTQLADLLGNPVPDASFVLISLVQSIVSWFLFAGVIYLLCRTLYRNEAVNNFGGILALVGFGRVSWLGLMVVLLIIDITNSADIAQYLLLIVVVWQLALLVLGVRYGLKLTWNHSLVAVLLPSVIVIFLLGGVYSLIQIA